MVLWLSFFINDKWYEKNPWAVGRGKVELGEDSDIPVLSMVMNQYVPRPFFKVKDDEEKTFSTRGVMIKALSFMLIMAVVFVFSYLFVDFSPEGKTDLQKGMSILPCFLGLIGYGLDILWLSQRFTRWAFVCSIVCKYAFFAMWGLMFAGVVHDRPEVWPVVVAVFVAALVCVVCMGWLSFCEVGSFCFGYGCGVCCYCGGVFCGYGVSW